MRSGRAHRRARRSVVELDGEARGRLRRLVAEARLAVLPTSDVVARIQARLAPGTVGLVVGAHAGLGLDQTVAVTELLAAQGFEVTPQIDPTGIRTERHLDEIVHRLARRTVKRWLMVERDPATPQATDWLLDALADHPAAPQAVGLEAYPQGRPGIEPSRESERLMARARQVSFLSTAPVVDAGRLLTWITETRVRGIEVPIEIGVPGVVPVATLRREAPALAASLVVRNGAPFDPTILLGTLAGDHAIERLDVTGLRLDTYNEIEPTENYRQQLYDFALTVRSG